MEVPSWQGLVYPPGTKDAPGSYLAEYAKRLGTLEVDQWFWSLFAAGVKLPEPATERLLEVLRERPTGSS